MPSKKKNGSGETPQAVAASIDPTRIYLCIWKDELGLSRAFGADSDKLAARKVADKARTRFERSSGKDLTFFEIRIVTIPVAGLDGGAA